MPDLNDVVRHVILRVLVDADTLGAELAKARAQLKGLEDSEKDANKRRAKAFEDVAKSAEKYTAALKENQSVARQSGESVEKSARGAAEGHKESAAAVKQETSALVEQGKESDRQASAEQKRKQDLLDAQLKRRTKTKEADDAEAKRSLALHNQAIADELALGALKAKLANDEAARQQIAASTIRESERNDRAARANASRESKADAEKTLAQAKKLTDQADALRRKADGDRKIARDESSSNISRRDKSTDSTIARQDQNALEARVRANTSAASKIETAFNESSQRVTERQRKAEEVLDNLKTENRRKQTTNQITDNEKINRQRIQNAANELVVQSTLFDTINTLLEKNSSARDIADANRGKAQAQQRVSESQAATAKAREEVAAAAAIDKAAESSGKASDRRNKSLNDQLKAAEQLKALNTQNSILEQRLASSSVTRAAAEERYFNSRRRPAPEVTRTRRVAAALIDGAFDEIPAARTLRQSTDNAIRREGAGAGARSSPAGAERSGGFFQRLSSDFSDFFRRARSGLVNPPTPLRSRGAGEGGGLLDRVNARVFNFIGRDASAALTAVQRLRGGIRGVSAELRNMGGGTRGGAAFSVLNGLSEVGDKFTSRTGPLLRFLTSFRGLILVVATALGPLAAILGAVGGAALGLASNLVALSGSLLALPGLISAAISGFGALALIMGPLNKVFSAYSAAQKAAVSASVDGGKAARDAANAYKDAQRAVEDAQISYNRAVQDAPRAQSKLADAYKDASREIQDYRLALQKLEYDQNSSTLGVESAEQSYRRALADPTANNLDRKIARNDVVGALFNQRDQQVSQGRLIEDAAEAERKGVEGSDQVIDAKRGVEDANRALADSYRKLKRAQEDYANAKLDRDAGGSASRKAKDELEAQLKQLGPETRKVVEPILALGEAFRKMQKRISDAFFKPLVGDTDKFGKVLQNLELFVTPAATALGKLASAAIGLFTNPAWTDFFDSQGKENAKTIEDLGTAALSVFGAFKNLIIIARPFTEFVTGGIKGLAESFEKFTASEKGRTGIAAFLDITKTRMKELKPIIGFFFDGFVGFFKALNGFGGEDFTGKINDGLLDMAKKFASLGEEAAKPNSGFRKWLRDVGPLIKDTVGFLGDAARFFGDLFSDKRNITEARDLFKSLGTFLDNMSKVFSELSESGVISKIVSALSYLADAFSNILDNGGTSTLSVFATFIEYTGKAIDKITELIGVIPGIGTALGVLGTILATLAGAAIFGKLTGLTSLLKGVGFLKEASGGGRGGGGIRDAVVDKLRGRESGVTEFNRDTRQGNVPRSATGGILPTLYRMENHLLTIIKLLGGSAGPASSGRPTANGPNSGPDTDDDGRRRNPSGGPTGGGGSTGGGGPGDGDRDRVRSSTDIDTDGGTQRDSRGRARARGTRRTIPYRPNARPKRRYTLPTGLADEVSDVDLLMRERDGIPAISADNPRRTSTTIRPDTIPEPGAFSSANPRRARSTTSMDPADPRPISFSGDAGFPEDRTLRNQTPRGNNRFRSERQTSKRFQRSFTGNILADILSPGAQTTSLGNLDTLAGNDTPRRRSTTTQLGSQIQGTASGLNDLGARDLPPQPMQRGGLFNLFGRNPTGDRQTADDALAERYYGPAVDDVPASSRRDRTTGRTVRPKRRYGPYRTPQNTGVFSRLGRGILDRLDSDDDTGGGFDVTGRRGVPDTDDDTTARSVRPKRRYGAYRTQPTVMGTLGRRVLAGLDNDDDTGGSFTVTGRRAVPDDTPTRSVRPKRRYGPYASGGGEVSGGALLNSLFPEQAPTTAEDSGRQVRPKRRYGPYRAEPSVMSTLGRRVLDGLDNDDDTGGSFSVTGRRGIPDIDDTTSRSIRPKRRYGAYRTPEQGSLIGRLGQSALSRLDGVGDDTGGSFTVAGRRRDPENRRAVRPKRRYGPYRNGEVTGGGLLNSLFPDTGNDEGFATLPTNGRFLGIPLPGDEARQQRDDSRRARSTRPPGRIRTALGQTLAGMNPDLNDFESLRPSREPRRDRSTGRKIRPKRRRGTGRPVAGGAADAEYDDGYDDGLNAARGGGAAGGGDDLASLVDDVFGDMDSGDDDDDDSGRRRRGTGADDDDDEGSGRRRRSTGADGDDDGRPRSRRERRADRRTARRTRRASRGPGRFARAGGLGGGLARGLAGGIGGLVAGAALQFGGEAAINKFVKNDDDANSLSRGLGAVSTGAGIGATIGSIIPGVGTVIGGAVGGLAGGAYSLLKDKNLRSFVGDKLGGAGKAVGGALKSAGSAFGSIFTGKDADGEKVSAGDRVAKAASFALGPVGALLGSTDIGKKIVDSLKNAGGDISDFFTKTIPGFFTRGVVRPIQNFFTKTLPSLPGRAFDLITTGLGVAFGFFTKTAPRLVGEFFTEVLPKAAADGFAFVRDNLFLPIGKFVVEDIPKFFTDTIPTWFASAQEWFQTAVIDNVTTFITETIPNFFTTTIPKWFAAAPEFFQTKIIDPITDFFTVSLPNFFTVTLPNAITDLPGTIYNNLIQPVLDFFGGIRDHVTDFLSGSFDWARNLFNRGSKNFEAGAASQSMSGGLVKGVYQGIEDTQPYWLTSEEFVVRRGAVKQPGGKAFLQDFNEGRITPADFYAGLSARSVPQVMSIVPSTPTLTGGVVHHSVDNRTEAGLAVGDITINNPVREPTDRSLRRALQIASIRHRR